MRDKIRGILSPPPKLEIDWDELVAGMTAYQYNAIYPSVSKVSKKEQTLEDIVAQEVEKLKNL